MSDMDSLIHDSLVEFAAYVAQTFWWGREREAVSLFAFGHLVPRCQGAGLLKSPTQIGIEVAVRQIEPGSNRKKLVCKVNRTGIAGGLIR